MANPSTANAHLVLIQKLMDNLPTGYSTSNVKLPNKSFTTPNNSKWLRATVINQDTNNVQAGGGWKRSDGLFVIDLFYPIDSNVIEQLLESEEIAALYQNLRFGGVNCHEALIQDNNEEGSWYNVQINVDFYYEGA